MKFRHMIDSDWERFVVFAERNFVSSHPVDWEFMDFWFRRQDGSWTVQLAFRDDETVSAVNMMIEVPGRFTNIRTPLTWMSTALAEDDAQVQGLGGQMLFSSHRSLSFVGCTCANQNSLPINEALGLKFYDLNIRRFVYMLTPQCLQIIDRGCQNDIDKLFGKKQLQSPENNLLNRMWVDSIPNDFNELWRVFSADLNCVVERDLDYMNWRYLKSPYQKYLILVIRAENQELCGLSVIRFQPTTFGLGARIVDFVARPECKTDIWRHVLHACKEKEALYADFFVMGTGQDQALIESGFIIETDNNCISGIPNLLSPIDYRSWSYTFHISGTLPRQVDNWMDSDKVWFTKGDGDRDWPTVHSIALE